MTTRDGSLWPAVETTEQTPRTAVSGCRLIAKKSTA